jgi:hypothetical protein
VYRELKRGNAATEGLHPLAVADEVMIELPQYRLRAAVATAMTALAREHVGLAVPPTAPASS